MTVAQMNNFFNTGQPTYFQPPPSQSWRVSQHDDVQVQQPGQGFMWSNIPPPPQAPNFGNSAPRSDDVILLDQDPHAPLVLPPPPPMPSLLFGNVEQKYESRQTNGSRWDLRPPQEERIENHVDDRETIQEPTSDDEVIMIGDCPRSPATRSLSPMPEYQEQKHFETIHVQRPVSPERVMFNGQHSRSPVRRPRSPSAIISLENDAYRRLQDELLVKYAGRDRANQNRRDREVRRTRSPERRRPVHRSRSPLERRRERSLIARRRSRSPVVRRRSRSPVPRRPRSPLTRRRTRSPISRRRSRSPISRRRSRSPIERRRSPPRRRSPAAVSRRRQSSPDSRRRSRSPVSRRRPSPRDRDSRRRSRTPSSRTNGKKQEAAQQKLTVSETDSTNTEEDPLQAFAKNFDAEEFRKKLQRKMMSKLKEKIAEEARQKEGQRTEGSEEGEVITPEPSATDIRLYYDKADDSNDENAYHPEGVVSGSDLEDDAKKAADAEDDGWATDRAPTPHDSDYADVEMSDTETPAYPWYLNSPIQQEISEKFLKLSKLEGNTYDQRPQQPEQDGIERTFPVKKRDVIVNEQQRRVAHYDGTFDDASNGTLYAPLARPSSNSRFQGMVKESGKGFVIRGNGTLSWVRRDKFTDVNAVPRAVAPDHTVFANSYANNHNHECYEFMQTKKCQAGALCKFDHGGDDSHRRIVFCYRFLSGVCRNGDKCPKGSHALLPHQIPVCEYFLRLSCPYRTGCPFLHVKHSDNTANCIHFNKGRCLSAFPCPYVHRYTPPFVRERCKHGAISKEDLQRADEEAESTTSINFDDITPLEWIQ